MRMLINTASTFKGGGVQVALSFLHELQAYDSDEFHVFLSEPVGKQISKKEYPNNFHFYSVPFRPGSGIKTLFKVRRFLQESEKKIQPDCVFTTTGPSYWRPSVPHLCGYNLPHHIYPESPYFDDLPIKSRFNWFLKRKLWQHWFAKEADAFVVQTEDVNQRLRTLINTDQVYTVSNTCSHFFGDTDKKSNKKSFLPPKKENEFRLLSIGAHYPHKNLDIINEIAPELVNLQTENKIHFVLTLPEKIYQDSFTKEAKQIIFNVGPQQLENCPQLYSETDALFLPTLLECFSASYAEAMAMGKPILTSDLGFAHTVCKDAALYFNPKNPVDIVDKIQLLIEKPQIISELTIKGKDVLKELNNTKERAEKYLNICENLVKSFNK